jgi:hypothetical protein
VDPDRVPENEIGWLFLRTGNRNDAELDVEPASERLEH